MMATNPTDFRDNRREVLTMKTTLTTIVFLWVAYLPIAGSLERAWAGEEIARLPELRLSLREAMDAAVDNNPTVRLMKERVRAAQATANTSLGAMLPNLSGFVNERNQTVNLAAFGLPSNRLSSLGLPSSGVTDPFNVFNARATIVQSLFSLSLIQRWQTARTGVEVATLDAEVTKRNTIAIVGLLYMEALRADAAVKATEANLELDRQLLELARERRKAGKAIGLDVTRAQVQLENDKQRLLAAQNDRDSAKLTLIRALGIEFGVTLLLTDQLQLADLVAQHPDEAVTVARENRAELKAQAMRQRQADLTLRSITSERLPSVDFNGDYGFLSRTVENAPTTYTVGVMLVVPIFDGGQREGRISEARSKVFQESIQMQDISAQVSLEVRDALLKLSSSREQVQVAQNGLGLARQELDLARERFAAGIGDNIAVITAQTSVARARDNLIEGLFRFNASRVNWARAQGQLEMLY